MIGDIEYVAIPLSLSIYTYVSLSLCQSRLFSIQFPRYASPWGSFQKIKQMRPKCTLLVGSGALSLPFVEILTGDIETHA